MNVIDKTQEPNVERCQFIKKNGKQCRQKNKPNQNGGEIIHGYCTYHCHLRDNGKEEVTTMN